MLSLTDPRWSDFKSGYRVNYDARTLLRRFSTGTDLQGCWKEVWNELHHQGDLDTASYAVVPYLVHYARDQKRDYNIYGYVSAVICESGRNKNPSVPRFLEPAFAKALAELFDLATIDLRPGVSPRTLRAILEYLAAYKGAPDLARAICDIDLFDGYGERVIKAERNGDN